MDAGPSYQGLGLWGSGVVVGGSLSLLGRVQLAHLLNGPPVPTCLLSTGPPGNIGGEDPKAWLQGGSCKALGLSPSGWLRAIAMLPVPVCSPLEMGNLTAGLSAAWNETRG